MNKHAFELAKKVSKNSQHKDHQVGSVITYKNRILSVGFNKTKTHPKSHSPWKTTHAEFDAVLSLGNIDYSKCSIYVYRELKTGTMGNSKPCVWCQKMLKSIGLTTVYYSHETGFIKEIL